MLEEQYKNWLKSQQITSFKNYISRLKTLESYYGDIDSYYEKDGCSSLLLEFEYSASDKEKKIEKKHKIPITSKSDCDKFKSYYDGTKDYSTRIKNYIKFREDIQDEQLGKATNLENLTTLHPNDILSDSSKYSADTSIQSRRNIRYKGNPIGNAQNLAIRTILSNLGNESFSEKDWKETARYFSGKCVYCGATDTEMVRDHAIPISKYKLGEHKLGNIVPACKKCNNKKGDQDYIEFCGDDKTTIAKIKEYMVSRNYFPLTEDIEKSDNIRIILHKAYEEIRVVAEKYIDLINDLFFSKR